MKAKWIKRGGNPNLIIFFGGFACDENLMRAASIPSDADLLMFFDYRSLDVEIPVLNYENVAVVAWSFGVWAAHYLRNILPQNSTWTAINGTVFPVDDAYGIPRRVFEKTLETFDEKNKERFFRRICGGSAQYEKYKPVLCRRSAAEMKDELAFLKNAFENFDLPQGDWDISIASASDKIFPANSMRNAWGASLKTVDGEHLNFRAINAAFSALKSRSQKIRLAFEKHISEYDENAVVQREISKTLTGFILKNLRSYKVGNVLEVGCGTGFLTGELIRNLKYDKWWLNDLSSMMCEYASRHLRNYVSLPGDIMRSMPDEKLDLIVSASCFQWIEELKPLIEKLSGQTRQNGMLAFSTFGPDNCMQLRKISGKSLKYFSAGEIGGILTECGYEVVQAEEEIIDVEFDTPFEVLKHVKATGVNGNFSEFWTPAAVKRFAEKYRAMYAHADHVALTYNPIYIVARKVSI